VRALPRDDRLPGCVRARTRARAVRPCVNGPWSAHLSMLFTEVPLLDRPGAARAAGFTTVETWWPGAAADGWAGAVASAGVAVALLNADGGDIGAGERGFLNVAALRERELGRIDAALALAARVGAPRVNVLAGRLEPGIPRRRQLAEV